MNKYLLFGCGIITGVLLTIAFAWVVNTRNSSETEDIVWFDKPGEIVDENEFMVMQVLADHAALVMGGKHVGEIFLLSNAEGKYYYDAETVKVPKGMVVRQVGIYRYLTPKNREKTVRAIIITDK